MAFEPCSPLQTRMPTLASWVLVTYGATLVVTGSNVAAPARRWVAARSTWLGKLASCPMCVGWWVGLMSWWALPTLCPVQDAHWYVAAPANAFAALAACWGAHVALAKLGAEDL
jgi:hypothetical protein